MTTVRSTSTNPYPNPFTLPGSGLGAILGLFILPLIFRVPLITIIPCSGITLAFACYPTNFISNAILGIPLGFLAGWGINVLLLRRR